MKKNLCIIIFSKNWSQHLSLWIYERWFGPNSLRLNFRKLSSLKIIASFCCRKEPKNENARVSHLLRVDGVQNSPNNFDLNPVTLTYDLWPWTTTLTFDLDPCDLDLGPSFLKLGWKLEFLHFWPWWSWPLTLTFKPVQEMMVLNVCAKF